MLTRSPLERNSRFAFLLQNGSLEPRHPLAKTISRITVCVLLCVSVLAPSVSLYTGTPHVRVETLLLVVCGALYLWLLLAGAARPPRFHPIYVIAGLFSFSAALSLLYGTLALGHTLLLRDFYEFPKAWLPAAFFAIAYEAELTDRALRWLLSLMAWVTAAVCVYGIAQYFSVGFTFWLNRYYSGAEHHDISLALYHRVYSTLGNPNVLGQYLSWTLLAFTLAYLFGVGSRLRNLFVPLMCVVTLVLTGSRYGLVAAAFGLLLMIALALAAHRPAGGLATLLLLIVVFGAVFANVKSAAGTTARRFDELLHPLEASSLRARLDDLWVVAGDYIAASPWVGHGPAKQLFDEAYTDSEYLDVMKQYGIFGLLTYLAYYLWPLTRYAGVFRAAGQLPFETQPLIRGNLLVVGIGVEIIATSLVMNIGEFTFYNWVLLAFIWLWIGLSVRSADFIHELAGCGSRAALLASQRRASYVHA